MPRYIVKRLLLAVPGIFGVTIIIFVAMRMLPGDVLVVMFGDTEFQLISDADRKHLEDSLGLGKSLPLQYVHWLKDIATLELGESFWRGDKVMDTIRRRGPISGEIALLAVVFSWLIGLPVGILAAMKQNSVWDYLARSNSILFLAIPSFWLGAMTVLFLVLVFEWTAPPGVIQLWDDPVRNMQIVLGPSIVLGLALGAIIARMARSTLLEVIREDYIRTARSKGLGEQTVVLKHALQNAILPVLTISGISMGHLLGGSIAVEQAFGVAGLGKTMVTGFVERDFAVIQNLVLLYGLIFVFTNLLVDIAYVWIDPRIRYG